MVAVSEHPAFDVINVGVGKGGDPCMGAAFLMVNYTSTCTLSELFCVVIYETFSFVSAVMSILRRDPKS